MKEEYTEAKFDTKRNIFCDIKYADDTIVVLRAGQDVGPYKPSDFKPVPGVKRIEV